MSSVLRSEISAAREDETADIDAARRIVKETRQRFAINRSLFFANGFFEINEPVVRNYVVDSPVWEDPFVFPYFGGPEYSRKWKYNSFGWWVMGLYQKLGLGQPEDFMSPTELDDLRWAKAQAEWQFVGPWSMRQGKSRLTVEEIPQLDGGEVGVPVLWITGNTGRREAHHLGTVYCADGEDVYTIIYTLRLAVARHNPSDFFAGGVRFGSNGLPLDAMHGQRDNGQLPGRWKVPCIILSLWPDEMEGAAIIKPEPGYDPLDWSTPGPPPQRIRRDNPLRLMRIWEATE
ncbi:MAG: hypothetical protein NkDv07_0288 [Candidatus Improbicoccus devescovinae]|nr:MAG: hypothetical protein NkDv07_0288 [Candidatus Improbicoccus devescovinae]